ncbi:hypothetical protein SAMN05192558_107154 [Actinokineospora alba]|uniref:Uncharacterized protein n=1 Tax=Actinokineospora alba TaxID=504798 RepID=A0A1H0QUJ9_9PSEU|nr:hypothetical protein C8E96_5997 [Actinokineospora alba]SDI32788.1 hypothetical protein SAMN05421871_104153 [Actinokineospora alba]SDP20982.1 hypothetical protein SAMN05192558_107154 [Actinokineospora alba]
MSAVASTTQAATAGPVWTPGPCDGSDGVTVAVDLTGAGRPEVVVRCAHGHHGDARAALEGAGVPVHAGQQLGAYQDNDYVCRVDGLPASDPCAGHADGQPYWKVWRVGVDPLSWRGAMTDGGPGAVRTCAGALVGFSFGVGTPQDPNVMTVAPDQVVTDPAWLPPAC